MDSIDLTVYDKAKYHEKTVQKNQLPKEQASIHTAFYLGWLIENDLVSEGFKEDCEDALAGYFDHSLSAIDVYNCWNRTLSDDMLSFEGNQFTMSYFNFEKGEYLKDYSEVLVKELPSEFHVTYNRANQELINQRISEKFKIWQEKRNKPFWKFWQ
ncbi:hypothetical protein EOPP23_08065 [Endozoicomonas sp. OPT23]|uniref:DUF7832 domain-containing protein n=1 Tax=Endozoicomonas sp. OPT23 TaxID=2072845 RepID=UPI00129A2DAE|nr:hypothetical protein [Endozoicomonas sp. OPT23]MRI32938.1 hypothetical protein [Endozoicomonas sp. OPT23]